jgi:hypothetical protein
VEPQASSPPTVGHISVASVEIPAIIAEDFFALQQEYVK